MNSKIGFQAALVKKLNKDVQDYCNSKAKDLKDKFGVLGVKIKQDSFLGWYLEVRKEAYEKNRQVF